MSIIKTFFTDESAATSIEYAFMAGLIIAVCIVGIGTFGVSVNQLFAVSRDAIVAAFGA